MGAAAVAGLILGLLLGVAALLSAVLANPQYVVFDPKTGKIELKPAPANDAPFLKVHADGKVELVEGRNEEQSTENDNANNNKKDASAAKADDKKADASKKEALAAAKPVAGADAAKTCCEAPKLSLHGTVELVQVLQALGVASPAAAEKKKDKEKQGCAECSPAHNHEPTACESTILSITSITITIVNLRQSILCTLIVAMSAIRCIARIDAVGTRAAIRIGRRRRRRP
ncbi:hypothetical protein [Sporisorium scitamineum]|uniref:Uncharacterized protein n=1 Tax=Sporisorium scitamineum TaxID=49012 RepID=A0A0F7RXF7_9BASI|nr:hypothetical protein [Sporisorium scitamineum]